LQDWELIEQFARSRLFDLYRARPRASRVCPDAPYVLKQLRAPWDQEPEAVAILRREALVGSTVSHPHVVPILAASVKSPPLFVVMPWLAGVTLDGVMAEGAMDLPEFFWICRQIAEALGALHGHGWTHGDIKPSNVFLSPEGHVTLLDLGFARRPGEALSRVDGPLTGTCHYIAPEAITSVLAADIRSDIYSLGVMLFQLLARRLPFEGKDWAEVAKQHLEARPPDLRRLAPHLSGSVVSLVGQMLAKEPLRRPQTPQELVRRLTALEIATFGERSAA
jgi:serine/threonine-protein kinase